MQKREIEEFLTYLATTKKVSPTTQNQAFAAILFLYKEVLGLDVSSWNIQVLRAKERKHIPQVLTRQEVKDVISELNGVYKLMAEMMYERLKVQVEYVESLHEKDLKQGFGSVYLPYALQRKYPKAMNETKWQYLFPMRNVSTDPRRKITRRHHVHEKTFGRNIKVAASKTNINKRVTSHIFRHSYATHLLQSGWNDPYFIDTKLVADTSCFLMSE